MMSAVPIEGAGSQLGSAGAANLMQLQCKTVQGLMTASVTDL